MSKARLTIDGKALEVPEGTTILEAARLTDIYVPTLCYHPNLAPAKGVKAAGWIYQGDQKVENTLPGEDGKGCGLCVVEIEGEPDLVGSCSTPVQNSIHVVTDNERIRAQRQEKLIPILAHHRHACLTCAQQEGCPRTQCSSNVPEEERCCAQFGHCELQDIANYVGISDATPKWVPTKLPLLKEDPLFERDYNLCIGCTRCVRACRNLRGIDVLGFVYGEEGRAAVGTLKKTLVASGCKFCTACVEVCPTGALADKSVRPGKKEEDLIPCKASCPANIDVPGYVRLVAQGRRDEALAVIREKVPFPGILGRVCTHPCEAACRRKQVNEPVAICALKRYAADGEKGLWKKASRIDKDTGKKVAVVGSGPAGLTAAFYLRKKGHGVTIFEAEEHPGGMMQYGIPAYRLPAGILEHEINEILDLGIDFRPNQRLGDNFDIGDLKTDGFDAVFLGVGASSSRRISLSGCDLPDVLWGVDFLKTVAKGKKTRLKENIVVIGGGNVAVDVALTALRCGANEVSMACLEGQAEMPASPWEIEGAVAEGVKLLPSWGPDKILSKNGRVTGIDLVECTCVFDDQGNFCPEFGDKKECIRVDQIILAIGQQTDLSFLDDGGSISVEKGLIVIDPETFETGMKTVFAGGDVTSLPGAIIYAVAAGRKAASSIDMALGGAGDIDEVLFDREAPSPYLGRDENFAAWPREKGSELDKNARHQGFAEISLGYDDHQAAKEAKRCLQCDLRLGIGSNPPPPQNWLAFDAANIRETPETEGVFQILDAEKNVLVIKATPNLREDLLRTLAENEKGAWFEFEENKMYSQRESELIQRYLQEHGAMPGSGDDDDDLF